MSPVPLKKQSRAGMSMQKRRALVSLRRLEPMMERVGLAGSRRTEVTIMWGVRWAVWRAEMAAQRVGRDVILVEARVLWMAWLGLCQ
jgi:hypothetical protein